MFIRYGQPISLLTQPVEEENGGAAVGSDDGVMVVISAEHSLFFGRRPVHALS